MTQIACYALGLLALVTVAGRDPDKIFGSFIAIPLGAIVFGVLTIRELDQSFADTYSTAVWHKLRWRCRERARARGSFTESLPAVPAGARLTARLRRACGAGIAEQFSCVLSGAQHYMVSWPVAHRRPFAHFIGGVETGPDVAALAGGGVDQDEPEALLALMQRGRAGDAIRVDVRMGDSPLPG